jgi:hypothetical protein
VYHSRFRVEENIKFAIKHPKCLEGGNMQTAGKDASDLLCSRQIIAPLYKDGNVTGSVSLRVEWACLL